MSKKLFYIAKKILAAFIRPKRQQKRLSIAETSVKLLMIQYQMSDPVRRDGASKELLNLADRAAPSLEKDLRYVGEYEALDTRPTERAPGTMEERYAAMHRLDVACGLLNYRRGGQPSELLLIIDNLIAPSC